MRYRKAVDECLFRKIIVNCEEHLLVSLNVWLRDYYFLDLFN
jgi:hypothetical protein